MLTQRDFEQAAAIAARCMHPSVRREIVRAFGRWFERSNPRFDATRFRTAVETHVQARVRAGLVQEDPHDV